MQNTRRLARELALKVLFQVDVGKQPLAEVMAGAEDQVRGPLEGALSQTVHEAQGALRKVVDVAFVARKDGMSPPAKRQLRQASEAAIREVRDLANAASGAARQMIAAPSDEALNSARDEVAAAVERARRNVEKLTGRVTPYTAESGRMAAAAGEYVKSIVATFERRAPVAEATSALMHRLVHGTTDRQAEIDQRIAELATGWSLVRQAAVDRNIMRLAAFEVMFVPDIPTGASINEAVELAKKYSTAESGRFVNGVLGALAAPTVAEIQSEPTAPIAETEGEPAAGAR